MLQATQPIKLPTDNKIRKVSILGSTGSVGCSTVRLIEQDPQKFDVEVLTANTNVSLLAEQARRLNARRAVVCDESCYEDLKALLLDTDIEVAAGYHAVVEAASLPVDWVMASIIGAAGLRPTLAAVKASTTVALANKEALVCAGDLLMEQVQQHSSQLLPVDSEHNAIFQVLDAHQSETIDRIILTASGGPFRQYSLEQMASVTKEQALKHPNWDMGAKITIDSATMMNKGLELIEAYHLFPVELDKIEILVHPESVIHSMVEYGDGSILAQLGTPDMRIPISYALGWPNRFPFKSEKLDFTKLGALHFEAPDEIRFPAIKLARQAIETGQSAPAILNAANEVAVERFLKGGLNYLDISKVVTEVLNKMDVMDLTSIDDVLHQDQEARNVACHIIDEIF